MSRPQSSFGTLTNKSKKSNLKKNFYETYPESLIPWIIRAQRSCISVSPTSLHNCGPETIIYKRGHWTKISQHTILIAQALLHSSLKSVQWKMAKKQVWWEICVLHGFYSSHATQPDHRAVAWPATAKKLSYN